MGEVCDFTDVLLRERAADVDRTAALAGVEREQTALDALEEWLAGDDADEVVREISLSDWAKERGLTA